ncbi:MAG: thiamine diphosphokinase [Clostridiales bacterium]|nr:thiamine diphosphokinase [Clostridiales bacterium]
MKEKLCIIFGAGEVYAPKIKPSADDLVIGADGGYMAAKGLGIEPNVVVGDFDSGAQPTEIGAHIIKLNPDKDDTDMIAAVKLGLRRGYTTFVLYGGVGGRLDHTTANFATLSYLNAFGAKGFLIDKDCIATVIADGKFIVPKGRHGTVSVFAYGGEASGVNLKNLTYELDNATLTPHFPLGVSNSTTDGKRGEISVKSGSLLIFFPR